MSTGLRTDVGAFDGLPEVLRGLRKRNRLQQAALPDIGCLGSCGQVAINPLQVLGDGLRIAAEDGRSGGDSDGADKK